MADLEFDLPPPGPYGVPHLMLGLRIDATEVTQLLALSDLIVDGGLPAKVRLWRIEGGQEAEVGLVRSIGDSTDRLSLPPDGAVAGVKLTSVDETAFDWPSGADGSELSRVLMFAIAEQVPPGRYRLSIELTEDHAQLKSKPVELLVAYFHRGK